MPTSLIAIGNTAFENCTGLTGVLIIPLSVTSIGNYAFFGCTNLSGTLTIPSLVTTIGNYAFNNCFNLTGTLIIPSLVTKIGDYTFGNCSGFNGILNIPSTVSSIGEYAFGFCNNLTSVNIPSSVNYIGIYAFDGCSGYFTVDVNNQNYSSSDGILFDKQKTLLIQCPTSIKGSYIISSTVNTIGVWAFENSSLTSVSIPTTVTSMGVGAFYNCSNLTSIYANATKPIDLSSIGYVFDGVDINTCTLYVPNGSKSFYQAAAKWQDFNNIVEFVTAVPNVTDGGSIRIYPNPVTDGFLINGLEGQATLLLMDLSGKILLNKQVNGDEKILVNTLKKGIYIVKLISDEVTFEQKVVKN